MFVTIDKVNSVTSMHFTAFKSENLIFYQWAYFQSNKKQSALIQLVMMTQCPEADLGMFSMFGRTGAPTKRGPHKKKQKIVR